tara:strand:- start:2451 stop:3578 length:1128 start_codon:yes stop_codon:yes gene_type:complete
MNEDEREQYRRHISLDGFGEEKQLLLKDSSVLVVGAGGLGCSTLQYLVGAGIGKIGIIDNDLVEVSNLQRQVLFDHQDIGKAKAEVASLKLSKMNPFIKIIFFVERFTKDNAKSLLDDFDVIIDGTDNFSSRYLINDACILFGKPLIHGSIHKFEGMVSVFNHEKGPTYRCLFPEQPDPASIPSCAEAGVIGVLPGIIGCWQALEAIKIITKIGEPLSGKVLLYNALSQSTRIVALQAIEENLIIEKLPDPIENCLLQSSKHMDSIIEITEQELLQMMEDDEDLQVLDVREQWERDQACIQPSTHQPLGNLMQDSLKFISEKINPKKKLVIYCKAGVRSRMACQNLVENGFTKLYNLSNGMDGWKLTFPEKTQKG